MVANNNQMDTEVACYKSNLRGSLNKNNMGNEEHHCTTPVPVRQHTSSPMTTPFRTPGLIGEVRSRRRSAPAATTHEKCVEKEAADDTIPFDETMAVFSPSTPVPTVIATQEIQVGNITPQLFENSAGISDSQMMSVMVENGIDSSTNDSLPLNNTTQPPTTISKCSLLPTPTKGQHMEENNTTVTLSKPKTVKKRSRKEEKNKKAKIKRKKKEKKKLLDELLHNQATICQQLIDLDLKLEAQCSTLMKVNIGGVMENIFEKLKEIKAVSTACRSQSKIA